MPREQTKIYTKRLMYEIFYETVSTVYDSYRMFQVLFIH